MTISDRAQELAVAAAEAASEKLADDILAFDVGEQLVITDCFVLCSAPNDRQVKAIVDAVSDTLDRTPPELASDFMERGIVVAGGGALLSGLVQRLEAETGMPVALADKPLEAVAQGSGRCLEEFEALERGLISSSRH